MKIMIFLELMVRHHFLISQAFGPADDAFSPDEDAFDEVHDAFVEIMIILCCWSS